MKHLPAPRASDVLNLRLLARNTQLDSYPALLAAYRNILQSYCSYRSVDGNAKAPAVLAALALPEALKPLLRNHYSSPPDSLKPFLLNLRRRTSPDVCTMCGSPKSGQLDHVFPKQNFPEFSVFSLNLVPACDCNVKRSTNFVGAGADERVLHPYFDDVLSQRVVRALIEPSQEHGYERPRISIAILLQPAAAGFGAVNFHVANVLNRTDVLYHFDATWPKYWERPEDYFGQLPTLDAFRQSVRELLGKQDRHFGTPNNWDSMLLAGIEANPNASAALWQRMTALRNQTATPQTNQLVNPQ